MSRLGPFELDTIVVGDCLDVMRQMPDGCVDAVITDPPYGVHKASWDSEIPGAHVWMDIRRVLKRGGSLLVMCGLKYLPPTMTLLQEFLDYQWMFAWYKPNAMQFGKTGFSKLDVVLWYSKERATAQTKKLDVIVEPIRVKANKFGHPTPKPVPVMTHLIECVTNPGDIIFDPFIGSGTTAVAAKKLGRHYFGCDINPEYVELARQRVAKVDGVQLELLR